MYIDGEINEIQLDSMYDKTSIPGAVLRNIRKWHMTVYVSDKVTFKNTVPKLFLLFVHLHVLTGHLNSDSHVKLSRTDDAILTLTIPF